MISSLSPSERYSVFGSPLTLTKGKTATESIPTSPGLLAPRETKWAAVRKVMAAAIVMSATPFLGFLILLSNYIRNKPLSIICSVKPNKALLVLTSCSSKRILAKPVKPSLISII